jgi:hypothetical protein
MTYDPSLQWAVLRLLERWNRLPLSDLERLLDPWQRPHFRLDLVRNMEWEGLVTLQHVGDEDVAALTQLGRDRLSGDRPPGPQPSLEERS